MNSLRLWGSLFQHLHLFKWTNIKHKCLLTSALHSISEIMSKKPSQGISSSDFDFYGITTGTEQSRMEFPIHVLYLVQNFTDWYDKPTVNDGLYLVHISCSNVRDGPCSFFNNIVA